MVLRNLHSSLFLFIVECWYCNVSLSYLYGVWILYYILSLVWIYFLNILTYLLIYYMCTYINCKRRSFKKNEWWNGRYRKNVNYSICIDRHLGHDPQWDMGNSNEIRYIIWGSKYKKTADSFDIALHPNESTTSFW